MPIRNVPKIELTIGLFNYFVSKYYDHIFFFFKKPFNPKLNKTNHTSQMAKAGKSRIKLVVVGDGAVGKTCLLWSYAKKETPPDYVPTVFDNYVVKITVGQKDVNLELWDTAGQEDLENIRVLSYTGTDVFLICFSVIEPTSFQNVQSKWLTELNQYVTNPTTLLIGTKKDLRTDDSILKQLSDSGQKPITPEEGTQKAAQILAKGYLECSAITREGVREVFDKAVEVAMGPPQKKSGCLIL